MAIQHDFDLIANSLTNLFERSDPFANIVP